LRVVCDGAAAPAVRQLLASPEARQRDIGAMLLPAMQPIDATNALIAGHVDLLIVAGPLTIPDGAPPLAIREWVRTPVILAVHDQVPVGSIKLDDLVAILAGWMTRWPDGTPVRLQLPPSTSRDLWQVKAASSGLASAIDHARQRPGLTVVHSDEDLADRIEAVPGSIGFTTAGHVLTAHRRLRPLLIDGIEPSAGNEWLGLYRLHRRIAIVRHQPSAPPVAALVEFLLADRHHDLLLANGLTPASVPVVFGD
jgi:ABC-type phosphate transport system substrate-binding protein